MTTSPPVGMKQVTVNMGEFVRTRDALVSAYTKLSSSIDKAVKAYIEHTDAVIAGDTPLDVSYLNQPFHALSSATQQLLINGAKSTAEGDDGKTKKRRGPKTRDPGAPKRPQTAYFLYMRDQRPVISKELADRDDRAKHIPGEVARIAVERWNKLDAKAQQKYKDEYHQGRIAYAQELRKFMQAGGKLTPGEEKLALASIEDIAAQDDDHEVPAPRSKSAKKAAKGGDKDEDDADEDSSDTSDDDDDDDDAEQLPKASSTPAKRALSSPDLAKKTPKSALKKPATKAAKIAASEFPPAPKFSSINAPASAKLSSLDAPDVDTVMPSSSPERKRKRKSDIADPAAPGSEPKKKRGRKTNEEKAAEQLIEEQRKGDEDVDASGAAAPVSEKKKEKKERKKRKTADEEAS